MDSRAKTEHVKDAASAVCLWHTSSRGRRQAKVCSREAGRNLRRGALRLWALALRELRPLARLLEAGLLALLYARVARQEATALKLSAQVRVRDDERSRDAVPERAGLRSDAAA